MKKLCVLSLILLLLTLSFEVGAKKTRIAKISRNEAQSDTIIIPESVFEELESDTITPIYMEFLLDEDIPFVTDEIPVITIDEIDINLTILGETVADEETMYRFVTERNPSFNREIAEAYRKVGELYGVRGDVALCQAIIETGWFLFTGGTAVTPDQNNFCGLGVTRKGLKGHSFNTIDDGVKAQIQHLYAYATKAKLPDGEKTLDPRFGLVPRGVAPNWTDLNNRWAANSRYGESIIKLYRDLLSRCN